jgi:hydroxymethylglutaryl-CoA lyase
MSDVTLIDVAPRDGFQAVRDFIPTDRKIEALRLLEKAGYGRIEIGACVSPKAIPQMADIDALLAEAEGKSYRAAVLTPNAKGVALALEKGAADIVYVLSVSEAHNRSNVRRSVDESFAELESALAAAGDRDFFFRFNLATCFDCPFDGRVSIEAVRDCVARALDMRDQVEFGICDTTGRAGPDHVSGLFSALIPEFAGSGATWAFHGHDTYGLGVANALAAYHAGVRIFDAAAGGLGGCPFAPGATGNTAAEDLVFAFEHMGVSTGIDLASLLEAADFCAAIEPGQAGGHVRLLPRDRVVPVDRIAAE